MNARELPWREAFGTWDGATNEDRYCAVLFALDVYRRLQRRGRPI